MTNMVNKGALSLEELESEITAMVVFMDARRTEIDRLSRDLEQKRGEMFGAQAQVAALRALAGRIKDRDSKSGQHNGLASFEMEDERPAASPS